jgi:mono/diheme cytochrome c family protein
MASQSRQQVNLLTPAPIPVEAIQAKAPPSTPDLTTGAGIYQSKCQPCHGDAGMGDGPKAPQVRQQGGQVAKLADPALHSQAKPSDWFEVVSNGRIQNLMPGFADSLSPQERWDVVNYVWALGVTSSTIQSGKELYTAGCSSCHGKQGKGDGPQAGKAKLSDLSGPAFLAAHSLNDLATLMTQGDGHAQVKLNEDQRKQVAEYVRSFGFPYKNTATLQQQANTGQGELHLQAQNLTSNSKPVSSLPVTLHVFDTTGEVLSRTATLNQSGGITFTGLITSDSYFYQTSAVYEGAKFYSAPAQFSGTLSISSTLPMYEVTTDPGVIHISQLHYFVQGAGDGSITVVEFYVFDNASDRAYVDKPGPNGQLRTLQVTVPSDATNLRFDGPGLGDRFSQDGNTIYDSDAVAPGQSASTIAMIYDLPYQGNKQIQRSVAYPVNIWDVLLPDGPMLATGLTDKGVQQMQSGSIHVYAPSQPTVQANGILSFSLVGQLGIASAPGTGGTAIGVGLVALALAGGMAYFLVVRSRSMREVEVDVAVDRQALLQEIADLDAQFAQGKIKEGAYRRKRQELKEMLREIWES